MELFWSESLVLGTLFVLLDPPSVALYLELILARLAGPGFPDCSKNPETGTVGLGHVYSETVDIHNYSWTHWTLVGLVADLYVYICIFPSRIHNSPLPCSLKLNLNVLSSCASLQWIYF